MIHQVITPKTDGEALVRDYVKTRSQIAKEKAIQAFLPLVKYIVGRINFGKGIMKKEDAYQFGIVGLLDALERYQPEEYGAIFKTFAYKRIYGEVVDAIRRDSVLSREQTRVVSRLAEAAERLTTILGREPLEYEILEEARVSEEKFNRLQQLSGINNILSLDDHLTLSEGDGITRKDTIKDTNQIPPDIELEQEGLKIELRNMIQGLPERQRLILALYYYEELTLFDIGQVLGISESRISQILNKTLADIRKKIVE